MQLEPLNPSPKARFQNDPSKIKAHRDLIGTAAYQQAEEAAMAHYSRVLAYSLNESKNPQLDSMLNGIKLAGVHEFISEFRNLAEVSLKEMPPVRARVLNHDA